MSQSQVNQLVAGNAIIHRPDDLAAPTTYHVIGGYADGLRLNREDGAAVAIRYDSVFWSQCEVAK